MLIEQLIQHLKVPGKILFLTQYGSHLYGLNTENSDLDFRGVFLPEKEDLLLQKAKDEYNVELNIGKRKVDVKLFSIHKFLKLCSKGDTNALDVLFSVSYINKGSYLRTHVEQFYNFLYTDEENLSVSWAIEYIKEYANKLINIDKLMSPISYAYKQATKYGLKGERKQALDKILAQAQEIVDSSDTEWFTVSDLVKVIDFSNKHYSIDKLDNKGTIEKYLNVCGVQHQYNLDLEVFIERITEKVEKEYTSDRTKNAVDGNDWKALSHALRILSQIKDLLTTGNYSFPNVNKAFLLNVKLGKISREEIDNYFETNFKDVLDLMEQDKLGWRYDEHFWSQFILQLYQKS